MTSLHHKLLRDLWRMRFQVLTIAILVGCGIGSFVAAAASARSLELARDAFYEDSRFADIFVHLERAPRPLLDRLRALPGVAAVEGRVVQEYRLEVDVGTEPVAAHFVSLNWPEEARLNVMKLVRGRELLPGSDTEVVVNDAFAKAWDLQPGASLNAVINGHRSKMQIVGVAISPEFMYTPSRAGFPDPRHYGVVWMDAQALGNAAGFTSAFNDFVIQLSANANARTVIDQVDGLLEEYGGLGAVERKDQPSAKLLDQKIGQLSKSAIMVPVIFLIVAAFLLNVLLSRVVGTQREQIATLKALGYGRNELLWHYLELALAICLLGSLFGLFLGLSGAEALLAMYVIFLSFPSIALQLDLQSLAAGIALSFGSGLLATFFAVRRAVAIPPAEAMHPEAPPSFKKSPFDRAYGLFSPVLRMVLRDVQRRPLRLLLSALSIALAVAIVVVGSVAVDSIAEALSFHFEKAHRENITVTLDRARPYRALRDIAHLPGVALAEGERVVPVRFLAGPRSRTNSIIGLEPNLQLYRLFDVNQRPLLLASGLSLSLPLAESLGVHAGDEVEIEALEAGRKRAHVRVAALIDDVLGISGYMPAAELSRILDEAPAVNTVLVSALPSDLDAVAGRLAALPAVAAVSRPELDRSLVESEVADVYLALQIILSMFAAAIAIGVVYNNARIALEMRSRDLATLRILGFTRSELAVVLLGEQVLQLVLGLMPGLWLGAKLGALTMSAVDRELIRIPFTLSLLSQVSALCVVVLAALISALIVRAQSDRLDLVAVLKARD